MSRPFTVINYKGKELKIYHDDPEQVAQDKENARFLKSIFDHTQKIKEKDENREKPPG